MQALTLIRLQGLQLLLAANYLAVISLAKGSTHKAQYFVLKSFQVRINPPDWFQLCLKEWNPCDHQKWLIPPLQEKGHKL